MAAEKETRPVWRHTAQQEDILDLFQEGYLLIEETVKKWGHNEDCDCRRCRWLRKIAPMAPVPMDRN